MDSGNSFDEPTHHRPGQHHPQRCHPHASAGAISIGFFALFGIVFGLTQYLQFVQGYTPLEAGLRMVPVALGIAVGAGFSHKLVGRLGTNKVVAMGMIILSGVLASIIFWQPDTGY
ncbi:MAG: MFS transporter, partial [Dehalococcoidia bacterium]|nr:MFS transporter [Dehalococcoidia bacterium]